MTRGDYYLCAFWADSYVDLSFVGLVVCNHDDMILCFNFFNIILKITRVKSYLYGVASLISPC